MARAYYYCLTYPTSNIMAPSVGMTTAAPSLMVLRLACCRFFPVEARLSSLNPFARRLLRPLVRTLQVVGKITPALPSLVRAGRAFEFGYGVVSFLREMGENPREHHGETGEQENPQTQNGNHAYSTE